MLKPKNFTVFYALLIIICNSCDSSKQSDSIQDTISAFNKGDTLIYDSLRKKGEIIHNDSSTSRKKDKIDSIVDRIYEKRHTIEVVSVKYIKSIQDADFNMSYIIQLYNGQRKKSVISVMIYFTYPINKDDTSCHSYEKSIKLNLNPLSKKNIIIKEDNSKCEIEPTVDIVKWVNSDGSYYPINKTKLSGFSYFILEMNEKTKIKDSLIKKAKAQ